MADTDIQPLVCDNGTGMVKVIVHFSFPFVFLHHPYHCLSAF